MEDQGNACGRKGTGDVFQVKEESGRGSGTGDRDLDSGPGVCAQCGTCCVAPDITALQKAVGERCRHLGQDNRCRIYAERPPVCRGYRPDAICRQIAAPDLEGRVARYLSLFGLG